MRKNSYTPKTIIRFKRWSRKQYSVFRSLKREVSIGVLSKSIAEASYEKSGNLVSNFRINTLFDLFLDEKETEKPLLEPSVAYFALSAPTNAAASEPSLIVESYNSAEIGFL